MVKYKNLLLELIQHELEVRNMLKTITPIVRGVKKTEIIMRNEMQIEPNKLKMDIGTFNKIKDSNSLYTAIHEEIGLSTFMGYDITIVSGEEPFLSLYNDREEHIIYV